MPITGLRTSSPGAYNTSDVFEVCSNYGDTPVARKESGWWCPSSHKRDSLEAAGCVPQHTQWGYVIKGPAYAGIGPAVELTVDDDTEPGRPGATTTFTGTVTVRGMQPGSSYSLYRITDPSLVPTSASHPLTGAPWRSWVAAAAERSLAVSFASGTPAYFICVAA